MQATIDQLRSIARLTEGHLDVLAETENAPSALKQQKRHIHDINIQLSAVKKQIGLLQEKKRKERKIYDKYYHSVVKRWAYKATGNKAKFAAKLENEGKRYIEVAQELHQANTTRNALRTLKTEALQARFNLEKMCTRRATAQREFDNLYDRIFSCPTPFTEVEKATRNVESALRAYNNAHARLKADEQVRNTLEEANKAIRYSCSCLENGRDALVYGFGGRVTAKMTERTALLSANRSITQARALVALAQHLSPEVVDLPAVDMTRGVEYIQEMREGAEKCKRLLSTQLRTARDEYRASKQQSEALAKVLDTARKQLREQRHRIFRHLADTRTPQEAPPPYT
ncbi:hypothetical protein ANO14919_016100 [Xylariales sp. No.14919]|nr:hypothetical protein ANO14919_016100 [Xylariales sp. No.14919]